MGGAVVGVPAVAVVDAVAECEGRADGVAVVALSTTVKSRDGYPTNCVQTPVPFWLDAGFCSAGARRGCPGP
ncbi:hypothetical protein [Kitasatospora griseola]|uniref:hypothetical protein n=1 Tax=Kitasatospora griseola TaxID=2064 RepID=UPI001670BCCC|nr:hypothetical protein [Kitasatospora griseola]GGQ68161.1 hypothetical protein GCM10010195_24810 [Kitasatospora griseola]